MALPVESLCRGVASPAGRATGTQSTRPLRPGARFPDIPRRTPGATGRHPLGHAGGGRRRRGRYAPSVCAGRWIPVSAGMAGRGQAPRRLPSGRNWDPSARSRTRPFLWSPADAGVGRAAGNEIHPPAPARALSFGHPGGRRGPPGGVLRRSGGGRPPHRAAGPTRAPPRRSGVMRRSAGGPPPARPRGRGRRRGPASSRRDRG